jgi:ketol-acid reductoisomerase
VREEMQDILEEIQSGAFAEEWIEEYEQGAPNLLEQRESLTDHPIEEVGRTLRGMMPWLESEDGTDDGEAADAEEAAAESA